MVLHIAAAEVQLRVDVFELAEDPLGALLQDVGQHVEPPAVRHGDDDFLHALLARTLKREVQQRDEGFAAFERKRLGADELALDELFEDHRVGQTCEDPDLFFARQLHVVFSRLHPPLQPAPHVQVVDVHELHADGPAVGVLQLVHDLPQRAHPVAGHGGGENERPVPVGLGQPVVAGVHLRRKLAGFGQRVEVSGDVATHPVVAHQHVHAVLQHQRLGGARARVAGGVPVHRPVRLGGRRVKEAARAQGGLGGAAAAHAPRAESGVPLLVDRRGVFEIRVVHLFDVCQVGAAGPGGIGLDHAVPYAGRTRLCPRSLTCGEAV